MQDLSKDKNLFFPVWLQEFQHFPMSCSCFVQRASIPNLLTSLWISVWTDFLFWNIDVHRCTSVWCGLSALGLQSTSHWGLRCQEGSILIRALGQFFIFLFFNLSWNCNCKCFEQVCFSTLIVEMFLPPCIKMPFGYLWNIFHCSAVLGWSYLVKVRDC